MKKRLILALLLVGVLSLGAFAFQNEPDGFRGLKWGDPVGEEMEYRDDLGGSKNYTRPEDKMSIGSAEFFMIIYQFYESRFLGVGLYFDGEDNYDLLEIICKERYEREQLDLGFYKLNWVGEKSLITLCYNTVNEIGFLLVYSRLIVLEKSEAEKKKEAEKAEGDW